MSDPAAPPSSIVPTDAPLPSGSEPNLHMIAETSKAIHEQVRFADAKASFIAAPNVVLFGYMANQADKLLAVAPAGRHVAFWVAVALVAIYAVTAVVSLAYVVLVVMPRHVSLGSDGRTHFGHVVQLYGTDLARYRRDLVGMSTDDWAQDLAGQVMEVSHIAHRKHSLIRRASMWTACSLATWVMAVLAVTLAR
jgi:hypothetical protein